MAPGLALLLPASLGGRPLGAQRNRGGGGSRTPGGQHRSLCPDLPPSEKTGIALKVRPTLEQVPDPTLCPLGQGKFFSLCLLFHRSPRCCMIKRTGRKFPPGALFYVHYCPHCICTMRFPMACAASSCFRLSEFADGGCPLSADGAWPRLGKRRTARDCAGIWRTLFPADLLPPGE